MLQFDLSQNRTHPDFMGIYIVVKFGTDWSIFADARVYTKSNMANFRIRGQTTRDSSGPIRSIIELIRNLKVIYILTKFGVDWLIFVDTKVLTQQILTKVRISNFSKFKGK